jgi:hypothetical protein
MSGIIADRVKIRPSTLPSSATNGELRVDSSDNTLKKYNETTTSWQEISGSGGGLGVNHLSGEDVDQESTVGSWVAYADAAASTPADGTGGSPTLTATRTTTNPLRGNGSLLLTKDAANRQGEGASLDFTIERSDAIVSLRQEISFEFEASAAFVTGDSADLGVYIYDVDQSTLINVTDTNINTLSGSYLSTWDVVDTTSRSYRLILHVQTTNASAWTLKLDQFKIGPQSKIIGFAGSDAESLTTVSNLTSNIQAEGGYHWRRGDLITVQSSIEFSGVNTDGVVQPTIPSGLSVDTAKIFSSFTVSNGDHSVIGEWRIVDESTAANNASGPVVYDHTLGAIALSQDGSNTTVDTSSNSPITIADGDTISWEFTVPISGWSSNISIGKGSTFKISNYLVNGTRVTSTPSALGEYRTYVKTISATSGTDNAPNSSYDPSAADGMRIDANVNYATAGTSGQPGRWEIYVGTNKQIKWEFYTSAGKTGHVNTDLEVRDSFNVYAGLLKSYDPVTGVACLDGMHQISTTTNRQAGYTCPTAGGAAAQQANVYFDIIVSENVQAIGVDTGASEIFVQGGNGHGSTDTHIRRYSNSLVSTGDAITRASTAANGDSFTINEPGVYAVSITDTRAAGAFSIGVSLNSSQLTTAIESITAADRISFGGGTNAAYFEATTTLNLSAGDVIRPHTDSTVDGSLAMFRITKIPS